MNNTKDAMFCRLCAELKQHNALRNLQTDKETCQKVVNKLSRFNIIMDFQENILPKTVCLICIKSLERAFVFVTAVEQAQAFLSDFILVQINTSASDSCDENMLYEPLDNKNGIVNVKEENRQNSMEVNDDGTNLSEKCDIKVMIEVFTDSDYSVINGNSKEHTFENKHDIQPSNEIIEESTAIKDEYVKTLDLYHVEDNKNNILKEELNSEPIPLDNMVRSADSINKQNYSNVGTKNMNKIVQQLQPKHKECNSKQIPPKRLATTVHPKTNIDKKQKTNKNKQKTSKMSLKSSDTDVGDIKMSWKDYEWKCCYCETLFPNIEELQKHSMQYHNSCNPYQCTDCVTKSSNLKCFMKHVRKHKHYLNYSCYKCFKKFPKLYQAGKHRKVHEGSDYVCSGCNTPFHSNIELKDHVNKYYKQFKRKPFDLTCSICNKNTASVKDLRKHSLTHKIKKDYVCETCGKCFAKKQQLRAHMVLHSAAKILHSCDICDASFLFVSKLRYHKTIHSGIKPFTCDHCGKSYRTKDYIAIHMKNHMGSPLNPCTLCNKKFRSASNLKKHMLQHTGEKPFSCNICLRDFTDLSNRNKHMRRIHHIELRRKRQLIINQQTTDDPTSSDLATGTDFADLDKMVNQSA